MNFPEAFRSTFVFVLHGVWTFKDVFGDDNSIETDIFLTYQLKRNGTMSRAITPFHVNMEETPNVDSVSTLEFDVNHAMETDEFRPRGDPGMYTLTQLEPYVRASSEETWVIISKAMIIPLMSLDVPSFDPLPNAPQHPTHDHPAADIVSVNVWTKQVEDIKRKVVLNTEKGRCLVCGDVILSSTKVSRIIRLLPSTQASYHPHQLPPTIHTRYKSRFHWTILLPNREPSRIGHASDEDANLAFRWAAMETDTGHMMIPIIVAVMDIAKHKALALSYTDKSVPFDVCTMPSLDTLSDAVSRATRRPGPRSDFLRNANRRKHVLKQHSTPEMLSNVAIHNVPDTITVNTASGLTADQTTDKPSPPTQVDTLSYEGFTSCIVSTGRILISGKDDLRRKWQRGRSVACLGGLIVSDPYRIIHARVLRPCGAMPIFEYLPTNLPADAGYLSEQGPAFDLIHNTAKGTRDIISLWYNVVPGGSVVNAFFRAIGDVILGEDHNRPHMYIRVSELTYSIVFDFLLSLPFVIYTRCNTQLERPAWLYTLTEDARHLNQYLEGCWIYMVKTDSPDVPLLLRQSGRRIVSFNFIPRMAELSKPRLIVP
ncbi:hypothetical protein J8273_8366 [Carpediemonas membranifera]|uniref:Uncharacterized protein n=1 Tax=Carpediemonas membranifera TaxID=201153 RepID=A0A8J6ARF6_9EUKA|nr:hypothetical protein J8273_8366 [Carpediemonas membranifera]|eukprot:KAG9390320.1 hypothetical protein J8273_8366 [Carpediemonas membranifera]